MVFESYQEMQELFLEILKTIEAKEDMLLLERSEIKVGFINIDRYSSACRDITVPKELHHNRSTIHNALELYIRKRKSNKLLSCGVSVALNSMLLVYS